MRTESIAMQRRRTQRRLRDDRAKRLQQHKDKLAMLRDLLREHEEREDWNEARDLKPRIRTLEQQIRYMRGGDYDP
jgi:protein-arginine kinase activator protein McsA